MGCGCSKSNIHLVKDDDEPIHVDTTMMTGNRESILPTFRVFTIEQVKTATSNFAAANKVVEWQKASGTLYNGTLEDQRPVSVARLYYHNRMDAQAFLKDARVVGRFRDRRLMNLLGCCNGGDERILIAEFMPNETLAKHLFDRETPPMKWAMRLRVALFVAQTLEYCISKRVVVYNLNPHNIFFDKDYNPRLSSFALMQRVELGRAVYSPDTGYEAHECREIGIYVPESAVYSFGCILLVLLSGREIAPSEGLDMIRNGKLHALTDPRLDGQLSSSDVTEVVSLATLCLQKDKKARPIPKTLVANLSPLQKEIEVPSSVLMCLEAPLSPLGEACKRKDLTAMHQILENLGYKDDKGATIELSFQIWANQMQETSDSKKTGDIAFRDKDFNAAINSYTKFIDAASTRSPTIHARRSLSYLMSDSPEEALQDAVRAQEIFRNWHIAYYLEAASLFALGKDNEAQTALRKGSVLERKNAGSS